MRTEPKASYRTVQYEYAYRYTPNIYINDQNTQQNTFKTKIKINDFLSSVEHKRK